MTQNMLYSRIGTREISAPFPDDRENGGLTHWGGVGEMSEKRGKGGVFGQCDSFSLNNIFYCVMTNLTRVVIF